MKNLFDVIESMDSRVAQVAALKAVAHGCLSRIIFGITSDVAYREREQLSEQTNDKRNAIDGDFGRSWAIEKDFGFEQRQDPMIRIHALTSIWFAAQERCSTLALTPYDVPMSPERMVEFFLNNSQSLDKEVLNMLAEAINADPADLMRLKEVQASQEKERLKNAVGEIKAHFEAATSGERLGTSADWMELVGSDIFTSVSMLDHHQLAVKVVEFTKKAKDSVLMRVLRTNRISDIGDIKLLDEGIQAVSIFIRQLERTNSDEFAQLIEDGRSFKTLADV